MKLKIAKAFKKIAHYLQTVFSFAIPFRIAIDGNFLHKALKAGIDIHYKLAELLGIPAIIGITDCCLQELKTIGEKVRDTYMNAKTLKRFKCRHPKMPSDECLMATLGKSNKMKYIIATIDNELAEKTDNIPSACVIYLNNTQLVIRPISERTKLKEKNMQSQSNVVSKEVKNELNEMRQLKMDYHLTEKQKEKIRKEEEYYRQTICMGKHSNTKGPNPLSRKKKKIE